jgi:Arc/MetJ-type ribon-helix-helix transcriptional regulator
MKRVQVQLTESQLEALRKHAAESGEGMSAVMREALDEWIAKRDRAELWDRAFAVIGTAHSGLGDLGERHDEYLGGDVEGW